MMVVAIAGRELRSLFLSPLAWSVLAVVQLILAYLFLVQLDLFFQIQPRLAGTPLGVTDVVVAPLYNSAAVVMLLVVPLITMRLISEERRSRTLTLLFSAPVSMTEIIIGKYLGTLVFLLIMAGLVTLMPLSLAFWGSLDWGKFAACVLGLVLLLASFAALGLFMSTVTVQPTVAAVSTFGALLFLWVIDVEGNKGSGGGVLTYLSILRHYQSLLEGVFSSRDVVYYLLFCITFLGLSIHRLDGQRLQQ
ncbi:MAG TPA: ABC transporter permease subunit [Gammaproteobacteria bacterium]|nr:ABC transporter permease subunit [Gammaproteobacteria bacterium]